MFTAIYLTFNYIEMKRKPHNEAEVDNFVNSGWVSGIRGSLDSPTIDGQKVFLRTGNPNFLKCRNVMKR